MLYTVSAYVIWGLFPFYFPLLDPASPVEILSHRLVWTFVFMAIVLSFWHGWRALWHMNLKTIGIVAASALVISINWGVYVVAVNSGHVAQAALGYFINPLVSVALAVIFLKESLTRLQAVSVGIATVAVIILTVLVGKPPIIALTLAFSFGIYGLLKKQVPLSSAQSLTAEAAIMSPLALAYLIYLSVQHQSTFSSVNPTHTALLIFSGIATAIPLLLFGAGAKRIPLTTVGLVQYITPCMQMLTAVFINQEQLSPAQWAAYCLIWVAVAIFITDLLIRHRKRHRNSLVRQEDTA